MKAAKPGTFFDLCRESRELFETWDVGKELREVGAMRSMDAFKPAGIQGFSNFQSTKSPSGEDSNIEQFFGKYQYKNIGCFGCPIECKQNFKIPGLGSGVLKCGMYKILSAVVANPDLLCCMRPRCCAREGGMWSRWPALSAG